MMVAILIFGLVGFALILWRNHQAAVAAQAAASQAAAPTTTQVAATSALNAIPIVGPVIGGLVYKNWPKIQTLSRTTGITGGPASAEGLWKKSYSDAKNFITSGRIIEPWKW